MAPTLGFGYPPPPARGPDAIASLLTRLQRTLPFEGWSKLWVIALIALVQVGLVGLMVLDWRMAIGAVFGMALVAVVLERPVLGISLLIMARLMDTSSNAFIRIGRTAIGSFELFLLVAMVAMAVYVIRQKRSLLISWPWLPPLLAFMAFQVLTLSWSVDKGDGVAEIISLVVVSLNAILILSFVRTPAHFMLVIYAWILACVLIGMYSSVTDLLGISESGPWKAAEGGGRETGLGQQPNWYAMNLMFIVHTCFGLALVQRRALVRWLLVGAGLFIFLSMLRSGSRGAMYAIIIGGGLAAMALPIFRKWFVRFLVAVAVIFALAITLDWGSTSQAVNRIWMNVGRTWSTYRAQNWQVCVQVFLDTYGRGAGAGGYTTLLEHYNWFIYNSDYDYPHGIFWGLLAHYGVIGLAIFSWLIAVVFRMGRRLVKWTRGSLLEVFAWTMPATMLGYFAWSFVEFEFKEKPFWEFLSLYTALYLIVRYAREQGQPLPQLDDSVRIPWRSALLDERDTETTIEHRSGVQDTGRDLS
jgi:O-antigen ligase